MFPKKGKMGTFAYKNRKCSHVFEDFLGTFAYHSFVTNFSLGCKYNSISEAIFIDFNLLAQSLVASVLLIGQKTCDKKVSNYIRLKIFSHFWFEAQLKGVPVGFYPLVVN